jgi:tRNA(Ile)-lysidine synthase
MLPKGETVLCALSGGMDSMALLHVLSRLKGILGFSLCAAHYNHRLRGEESIRDADFVASYCRDQNISLFLGEGDVEQEAKNLGQGIEETARSMRYAFLEDAAQKAKAARIVTAHHADDNVETVLLHLVRGTGLRGLTGIPPVRGIIVRPLLTTSRQEIVEYVRLHHLPFVEDSSNEDNRFSRNRIRHQVLPILQDMNPNLTGSVTATVRSLREDQAYLEARALELFREAHRAEDGMVIASNCLGMVPKALAVRVILRMLEEIEAPTPSQIHLHGIIAIAQGSDPSASLHLPGGVLVQRVYGDLLLAWDWEHEPLPPLKETLLELGGLTEIGEWQVSCHERICPPERPPDDRTVYLDVQKVRGPLLLRSRQTGDMLALPGRRRKTLKKLMIEERIPRRVREQLPILSDGDGVVAVAGLGPDRTRLASAGQLAYELSFAKRETELGKVVMKHGEGY